MTCPHCAVAFFDDPKTVAIEYKRKPTKDTFQQWVARACPTCGRPILGATRLVQDRGGNVYTSREVSLWPPGSARPPLPPEVPEEYAAAYNEAARVLDLAESPNASAALSRRCLQRLLRDNGGVKPGKLFAEIDEVTRSGTLPPYITELLLDEVRHFGNFGAHPNEDIATGEVVDVAPDEAEWCLGVLETLFDFYLVQPAVIAGRKAKLDEKLKSTGQKPTS